MIAWVDFVACADPVPIFSVNRFAGTRLEDLQGEIAGMCKDQHGCRYLQKKLEESVPEHRDMIFRETFSHFADLMTGKTFSNKSLDIRCDHPPAPDPFGNYLCQKLLEYSTDEQRSLICESVAKDLVNISLNMHGTRAVQKMIDFLSTRRQASLVYKHLIYHTYGRQCRLIFDTMLRFILSLLHSAFMLLC